MKKGSHDSSHPSHPAIIHEVRRKGLFIELTDFFIKGLVPEMVYPIVVKVIGSMDRIHASLGRRKEFFKQVKVSRLLSKTLTLIND